MSFVGALRHGVVDPRRTGRYGGSISFFQGSGPGSDKGNAPIVGGKYVIDGDRARNLTPGTYTVRIFWLQLLNKPNSKYVDASAPVKQLTPRSTMINRP